METVIDWLEFGRELKVNRDKIVAQGGYYFPAIDGSTKWQPLTDEMKATLFDGDPEPQWMRMRCPVCNVLDMDVRLIKIDKDEYQYRIFIRHGSKGRSYRCSTAPFSDTEVKIKMVEYLAEIRDHWERIRFDPAIAEAINERLPIPVVIDKNIPHNKVIYLRTLAEQ